MGSNPEEFIRKKLTIFLRFFSTKPPSFNPQQSSGSNPEKNVEKAQDFPQKDSNHD
jgi:hypothetical protein